MRWKRSSAKLRNQLEQLLLGHEQVARRAGVRIGSDCRILSNIATTEAWLISVGDRVTVSSGVRLVTHDGSGCLVSDESGRRFRYAPISIGDDVFLGAGTIVLPGVRIGSRCVVGAGSVVTRSVPDDTVVAGSPAVRVGSFADYQRKVAAWPSAADRVGATYREKVDSIAETEFRPYLG